VEDETTVMLSITTRSSKKWRRRFDST